MPLVMGTCSGRRGAEGRRRAMLWARRCPGSRRQPGCSVMGSCQRRPRHEKYVGLPAPKCGATVIGCHHLLSGAMKYPSLNIFLAVYHTTMKNPISPVDLLIHCPTKPRVKAWTLFYLFHYLKIVLAPGYLNTYAIKNVLSYFRAKQTSPICQLFLSSHIPLGRYK